MFGNPPGVDLPIPMAYIVLGLFGIFAAIGVAWLRRITRGPEDDDDHWRYRR